MRSAAPTWRQVEFRVMGVDPGFKKLGVGFVRHRVREDGYEVSELEDILNISTEKDHGKNSNKQKADDKRRLHEIVQAFFESASEFKPHVFAFEAQPFVRNARVSAQIAMAWASCWTLATVVFKTPVLVYDPKQIKFVTTKNEKAEKEEVETAVREEFPLFTGWPEGDDVFHVADAVGAAMAAIESAQFKLAVREWRRKGESGVDLREAVATAKEPSPRRW